MTFLQHALGKKKKILTVVARIRCVVLLQYVFFFFPNVRHTLTLNWPYVDKCVPIFFFFSFIFSDGHHRNCFTRGFIHLAFRETRHRGASSEQT